MKLRPEILGVYYERQTVGHLEQLADETYRFRYAKDWLTNKGSFPLSIALPLQEGEYDHRVTLSFFENLLPEESVQDSLARRHRIASPFQFLQKFGKDCAGAIAISEQPPGSPAPGQGDTLIDAKLLETALDEHRSIATVISETEPGYLSLAGAQDKFAAIYRDGQFYLPLEGEPTTHIVKPAIAREAIKGSVYNEVFVMRLAAAVGLTVPRCDIHYIRKHPLYVIERYDRNRLPDGRAQRLHQEDFCQAQGLRSSQKYESAGGPTLVDHFNMIKKHSHPTTRVRDLEDVLRWLAFNLFVGNNDCHAKNLSFLHKDSKTSLAPFYDLLCTAIYPHLVRSFTYAIGDAVDFNQMGKNRIAAFEQQLGVKTGLFVTTLAAMKTALAEHSASLAAKLKADHPQATIAPRIAELIDRRSRAFRWLPC